VTDPRATIPYDRLPESFARSVDHPPAHPVPARPAATVVLMRGGKDAPEVLLLKRVRSAGFVPGAWVFPGGRVDDRDGASALVSRLTGITPAAAQARLGLADDANPPAIAYWVAAVREAFEETGILVGRDRLGQPAPPASQHGIVRDLLDEVRADETHFASALDRLECTMDGGALEYIAHWITPVVEPRRFDTRFFAAVVTPGTEPAINPREISSAVWLTAAEALELNVRDTLPMVFPTIRTLESLLPFRTTGEVLEAFRARAIPTIMPRLVSTPRGVGMELEETRR
jgi:8-oxo-dGTP pyrophosphatase MutT (NUDIX family)